MANGKPRKAAAKAKPKVPQRKAAPKQKPKASKPKVKPRPRQARIGHVLSPHHSANVPTLLRTGHALPYSGMIRFDLDISPTQTFLFAITNNGVSGTVASFIRGELVAGAFVANGFFAYTIPTLALADSAGGPTSARSMKIGVSLVNNTSKFNMGGRVFHLNCQQRIRLAAPPSTMTGAQLSNAINAIKAFPKCVGYSGPHFEESREFTGNVVDNTRYEDFDEFIGTQTVDEFWDHIAIWPGGPTVPGDRPMSTIFLMFTPPAVTNTYTISVRASYYTRWALDTIPGQTMKPIPTADPATINAVHAVAEKVGDVSHVIADVGEAGLEGIGLGAVARTAYNAVSSRLAAGSALEMAEAAVPFLRFAA